MRAHIVHTLYIPRASATNDARCFHRSSWSRTHSPKVGRAVSKEAARSCSVIGYFLVNVSLRGTFAWFSLFWTAYMYACMHICIMFICMYVCIYARMHVSMCSCMYALVYACMNYLLCACVSATRACIDSYFTYIVPISSCRLSVVSSDCVHCRSEHAQKQDCVKDFACKLRLQNTLAYSTHRNNLKSQHPPSQWTHLSLQPFFSFLVLPPYQRGKIQLEVACSAAQFPSNSICFPYFSQSSFIACNSPFSVGSPF